MTEVATQQEVINVAIVEDVRALRDGFRMLIDGTEGFRCLAGNEWYRRRAPAQATVSGA